MMISLALLARRAQWILRTRNDESGPDTGCDFGIRFIVSRSEGRDGLPGKGNRGHSALFSYRVSAGNKRIPNFNPSSSIFSKIVRRVSHTFWRNLQNESGMSLQMKQFRRKTGSATWLAEPASWRKV